MDFEKFSDRARGFIQAAQTLALRRNHQQFTPEHVLKALLDDSEGLAAGLIQDAGGDAKQALGGAETALKKLPVVKGSSSGLLGSYGVTSPA